MNKINLFPFQKKVLEDTKGMNKVAYYLDMGLGKTFVGAEKAFQLGQNILIVCQKSKISDWVEHVRKFYGCECFALNNNKTLDKYTEMIQNHSDILPVAVINYDLIFRRPDLKKLEGYTLLLDESSLICNEKSKRAKFILNELHPANVVLLSGTPTNGKYELLWSQLHLLGWKISKDLYWQQYVDVEYIDNQGFPIKVVRGYKNVDRLKQKMRGYGCVFLKTDEVFDLPEQIHQNVFVQPPKEYKIFQKNKIVGIEGRDLVGDTVLTLALYSRQICGVYCAAKIEALKDLLESSSERFLIFYNFNLEVEKIKTLCNELGRPVSVVNGSERNLNAYENDSDSVTLIQYQAGSMGLNLQKACRIIYFTLPWGKGSCGNFEQSKKRIHRIGQKNTCYYYYLLCRGTIEETNLDALNNGTELTDELFREVMENGRGKKL